MFKEEDILHDFSDLYEWYESVDDERDTIVLNIRTGKEVWDALMKKDPMIMGGGFVVCECGKEKMKGYQCIDPKTGLCDV